MRYVTIKIRATKADAATAYHRISDFASYPLFTDTVREVVVRDAEPDSTISDWTVWFRKGLLRWTERDTFDPKNRTITFTQITGDFAVFDGSWAIEDTAEGSVVIFDAVFDLGIPTLAELLDPVAESTLRNVIWLILTALLGQIEPLETAALGDG
jgi:ribosome-associated toxin RatA of RatAB toxin-antitoxin module